MIDLDDDLTLVAPGAAWHRSSGTLIVSDLHVGYVATLQKRGHTLPSVDDGGLITRIAALLACVTVSRVVVAGDLAHGAPAYVARGAARAPIDALLDVLDRRLLVVVPGNHDRGHHAWLTRRGVVVDEGYTVGAHRILHGDEEPDLLRGERALAIARGGRVIVGHYHPALTLDDHLGARRRVAAFAYAPGALCLPALTDFARGVDLMRDDYTDALNAWVTPQELQIAAVVGARVIVVGTLARLRAVQRNRRAVRTTPRRVRR